MNADGSMRDSDTVYWEVIDALGRMKNETERRCISYADTGKSAQDLNPLIEAGSARMNELGKEAQNAGYVVGDEMLSAYGAFDDQLQYLSVGATAAKNALGTVLLPVLTDLSKREFRCSESLQEGYKPQTEISEKWPMLLGTYFLKQ